MQADFRVNRGRLSAARVVPFKRARFWLICLFFFSGRARLLVGSSGFRLCITKSTWNALPSSSSAPLKSLRIAVCSTTATCANWP